LLIGGLSTLTQYLTWFGKTAYIHGRESILLEIRERIYMEEEDHFTQTLLPALIVALAAAAMAARLLPLQLFTFSHLSYSFCSLTYAYK
jgi:hypothetical protein